MGLDIHLKKIDDFKKMERLEAKYSAFITKLWKPFEDTKYDSIPQETQDKLRDESDEEAKRLGLSEHGIYPGCVAVEKDSKIDPGHLFKVGYFRSSYNDSGCERVLEQLGCATLHDIFPEHASGDYYIQPDWQASRARVEKAIAYLKEKLKTPAGQYRAFNVRKFVLNTVKDEQEALKVFVEKLSTREDDKSFRSFGCREGDFHLDGLMVYAFIPGEQGSQYIITKQDGEDDNLWYLRALEIVLETIDFVLAQKDINQYYLVWSS